MRWCRNYNLFRNPTSGFVKPIDLVNGQVLTDWKMRAPLKSEEQKVRIQTEGKRGSFAKISCRTSTVVVIHLKRKIGNQKSSRWALAQAYCKVSSGGTFFTESFVTSQISDTACLWSRFFVQISCEFFESMHEVPRGCRCFCRPIFPLK